MERSKLPVPRAQGLNAFDLHLPTAKKPCPQKPVAPLYSRDPNIAFSSAAPNGVVFKAGGNGKKPVASKKASLAGRGPVNRYLMGSELKDKNQLLEAANASLTNSLAHAQNTIRELTEQHNSAKEEMKELERRLERSMIILESRNIDPVSGDLIVAVNEETSKVKEETKTHTENLIKELNAFTQGLKEQKELTRALNAMWAEAEKSRDQFLQEQGALQSDLEQFQRSLEEAEKWLEL